jgi:hypothetical protein
VRLGTLQAVATLALFGALALATLTGSSPTLDAFGYLVAVAGIAAGCARTQGEHE